MMKNMQIFLQTKSHNNKNPRSCMHDTTKKTINKQTRACKESQLQPRDKNSQDITEKTVNKPAKACTESHVQWPSSRQKSFEKGTNLVLSSRTGGAGGFSPSSDRLLDMVAGCGDRKCPSHVTVSGSDHGPTTHTVHWYPLPFVHSVFFNDAKILAGKDNKK